MIDSALDIIFILIGAYFAIILLSILGMFIIEFLGNMREVLDSNYTYDPYGIKTAVREELKSTPRSSLEEK